MANPKFWAGRRVMVTGHTGFKGTWLATWLAELGAEVTGIGLAPATDPSLFAASGLPRRIHSRIADVRSRELLARHLREAQPEILFHLAAQPLVMASLEDPVTTFQTNILGVVNLLDAARRLPSLRAIVVITSDKCYLAPGPPLCRGRPAGRARSLQRQQGLRRDRRPGATAPATSRPMQASASRLCAPATSSAAATSRPGGCSRTWCAPSRPACRRSCGTRAGSGPGSTCSTRWRAICSWPSAWPPTRPRSRPPGTSARTRMRAGPRPGSPRSRPSASAAAPGGRRRAISRSRCRPCSSPPSRPAAGSAGARGSSTEQAVAWAIDGYRALLREHDTSWLIEQIRAYAAPDRVPRPIGLVPARPARAHPCLRLSRPMCRSSSCAAGWAPAWARSRRRGPSPCSTSARSRCCCTSWAGTPGSAFAASSCARATAAR